MRKNGFYESGFSGLVCEIFASTNFEEHLRTNASILLRLRLFFNPSINVHLIFKHFTCYLSISRHQLSSVFSWSLTYLARALVMLPFFMFFLIICVTEVASCCLLKHFITFVASLNYPKILLLPLLSMLQLEMSKWLRKYKRNKFNYVSVIDYVCKFLLSVFDCSGV